MATHTDSADDSPRAFTSGRSIAIVLWVSFLAASVATIVFFGYFDPVFLGPDGVPPPWLADRMTGYAAGFFFFWCVCTLASWITAFMISTREPDANEQ